MLDPTFELLKDCNLKLNDLKTPHYRFVAWVIYSVLHECFIAGVDTYTNDEENLQIVALKAADIMPFDAVKKMHSRITQWHNAGEVQVEEALLV